MTPVLPSFTLSREPSPLGTLLVVSDDSQRIAALDFEDCTDRLHLLLRRRFGPVTLRDGPGPAHRALEAYFAGDLAALDSLPVRLGGTAFQQRVWTALRTIPAGTTETYGGLARRLGDPAACRAVGRANALNPIALIVPCHRVIGGSGKLTGYAGGLHRKRLLLDLEAGRRAA